MPQATVVVTVTTPTGTQPGDVYHSMCVFWGFVPDTAQGAPALSQQEKDYVQKKLAGYFQESYTAALATAGAETGRQQGITEAEKIDVT